MDPIMHGMDIGRAHPEDSPVVSRADLPWVHLVWAVGMLVLCGGWTLCGWKLIATHQSHDQAQLQTLQNFHAELLDEMQSLAGYGAVNVTEDLCRVRFRLRLHNRQTPPAGEYSVSLTQHCGPRDVFINQLWVSLQSQQIADFGLLTPGNYCLSLQDSLGMTCTREFEVLPGVAVDRVVYCPDYKDWMYRPDPFSVRLQLEWPSLWESQPIVAVVHLRAGSTAADDWHWQPPRERQFETSVVLDNGNVEATWDDVRDVLPQSIVEATVPYPEPVDQTQGNRIEVPYGCCEVTGVSLVMVRSADAGGCSHLGTIQYHTADDRQQPASAIETVAFDPATTDIITIVEDPPRQVDRPGETPVLKIPLARILVPIVL